MARVPHAQHTAQTGGASRLYTLGMGLLALLAFGSGLFFAESQEQRFERLAAADIRTKLDDVQGSVKVDIRPRGIGAAWGEVESASIEADRFSLERLPLFTEPWRSQAGKLGRLDVHLTEFQLRKLHVAELRASIPDCRFDFGLARDKGQMRLSRSGTGEGWVVIRQDDLADYLVRKFVEIKSARVVLANQEIYVEGEGEFLMIKTHFVVRSKLAVRDGRKIDLVDARVFFNWDRAEASSVDALLKTLNPVIDLDEDLGLFGAVEVETLDVRSGQIRASGKTRIPESPIEGASQSAENKAGWLPPSSPPAP